MICFVCGKQSGDKKTCSTSCRVALHRLASSRCADTPAFLYIAKFRDVIKFGCSRDPSIRLRQIELSSGRIGGELIVYGPIHSAFNVERDIHNKNRDLCICGEWYEIGALGGIIKTIESHEEIGIEDAVRHVTFNEKLDNLESFVLDIIKHSNSFVDVFGGVFSDDCDAIEPVSRDAIRDISSMILSTANESNAVNALDSVVSAVLGVERSTSVAIAKMLKDDIVTAEELLRLLINEAIILHSKGGANADKSPAGEIISSVANHLCNKIKGRRRDK